MSRVKYLLNDFETEAAPPQENESGVVKNYKYRLSLIVLLTTLYFIAGKLGLTLAFLHPNASAVWPCSGIALGALLIFGYEVWPGILLGAFLINLTISGNAILSLGIAAGSTLEALAAAWLVYRFAGGRNALRRTSDIFKFAILGSIASPVISATVGVASQVWSGLPAHDIASSWLTWWLGDAVGYILITPLMLHWRSGIWNHISAILLY